MKLISTVVVWLFYLSTCSAFSQEDQQGQFINTLGVNIHFRSGHIDQLKLIKSAGFRVIRVDMKWEQVEKVKGAYDWSEYDAFIKDLKAVGLRPMFILDYSNRLYEPMFESLNKPYPPRSEVGVRAFSRWAATAAKRYSGENVIWEVWNEPNHKFHWPSTPNVNEYFNLLKATYTAIKSADNQAFVVGPASAGIDWDYLEGLFSLGGLQFLDAVTVHPYRDKEPETVGDSYDRLKRLIADSSLPGKFRPPVVSGEWGYPTHSLGITWQDQAKYIVRMFLTNYFYEIPLSIWYDWRNDGNNFLDKEHNFGILINNGKPKPAFFTFKNMSDQLNGLKLESKVKKDDIYAMTFSGSNGNKTIVVWSAQKGRSYSVALDCASNSLPIVNDLYGSKLPYKCKNEKVDLSLDDGPLYIKF